MKQLGIAAWHAVKTFWNKNVHFLQLHYLYVFLLIMISSGLFYCQPGTDWNYADALFMATTAATNTGLNTIDMSKLSLYQILVMFFMSFFGSHVTVNFIVVLVRKHFFSKRFEDYLIYNKAQRLREENRRRFSKHIAEFEARFGPDEEMGDLRLQRETSRSSAFSVPAAIKDSFLSKYRQRRRKSLESKHKRHTQEVLDLIHHFREKRLGTHDKQGSGPLHFLDRIRGSSASSDTSNPSSIPLHRTQTSLSHPPVTTKGLGNHSHHARRRRQNHPHRISSPPVMSNSMMPNLMSPTYTSELSDSPPAVIHPQDTASTNISSIHDLQPDAIMSSDSDHDDYSNDMTQSGENTMSATQGIAFADNIEQQREIARRRLEQDRRFEELLKKIAGDADPSEEMEAIIDTDDQDDDLRDILREPMDKSQLTRQQRYHIGGAEYCAIEMLTCLVPIYYLGFVIVFAFLFRAYVQASGFAQEVLQTSNSNGPTNPWTFSFFMSLSAFNNLGLSPLDASMVPFQNAPCPLIFSIILILAGNTAFAIALRFIIWTMYKLTPRTHGMRRETLRYLLDHPRRCYTTLFPSTQTWWLLIILVIITVVELTTFLSLNYWLPVLEGLPWGSRIIDGLFQSVATRNAGFSVVSLMDLNPGTQLVFIIAMYISVYPVAISMRNSNVYQERALGIYRGGDDESDQMYVGNDSEYTMDNDTSNLPIPIKLRRHPTINSVMTTSKKVLRRPDFFVMTQIQRQLTSEICWVIICIFAICVIESKAIMGPSPITIATVIYECVSAFGNVGASTGYPDTTTSQAGQYRILSKLVLILLMYRGRHRGLPAAIDRAVLLPSEQLEKHEVHDHMLRRRNTTASQSTTPANSSNLFYTRSSTL